jgi:nucleoside-diphosphate-sugar epimerase
VKIVVTGANGFVGRAVTARLRTEGHEVVPVVRTPQGSQGERTITALDQSTEWREPLRGADAVIHLAARVQITKEAATDSLGEYRRVNTAGTLNLARQAAEAGVRRFLFMSTIKVNGESTSPGKPFTRDDPPAPTDPYAISKYEAEQGLASVGNGMSIVVVRPPLVYGPGVKGNLRGLLRWVERGVPLPFGGVADNRRSLVALGNLVDLAVRCVAHPAPGKLYLVSDGCDLSTRALVERIAMACARKPRLIPIPPSLLRNIAALAGKSEAARRFLDNLQIDMTETRSELGWEPPFTVDQELERLVQSERT